MYQTAPFFKQVNKLIFILLRNWIFNLQACFEIPIKKIEIYPVLDALPAAIKKALKNKKEKKKKRSLKKVMNNMPSIFGINETIYINKRSTSLIIIGSKNISLLQFFKLYINTQYLEMIISHTNINAEFKHENTSNNILELDSEHKMPSYLRP